MTVVLDDIYNSGVMWMGSQRAIYIGSLGEPKFRVIGSLTIYASLGRPFKIRLKGQPLRYRELAVIPPYVPHWVSSEDPLSRMAAYMIEPESIDYARLPKALKADISKQDDPAILRNLRDAYSYLQDIDLTGLSEESQTDQLVLGRVLTQRCLDPRIAAVVERMSQDPTASYTAEECASEACLSFSRFLHLFKDEVGVRFRQFRAWRRARQFLGQVDKEDSLTNIAIELGYPDATHFSHSIRQIYGMKPRDICAAMRDSAIVAQDMSSAA